jgi:hypothetical protein
MPTQGPNRRPFADRSARGDAASKRSPPPKARVDQSFAGATLGREGRLNRSERIRLAASWRTLAILLLLTAGLLPSGCGPDAWNRVAGRILEDYRKRAAVRPLAPAGSIRVRLSPAEPSGGEDGTAEIEWTATRYRETVISAGVSTVRGIQGGKAFFTDEDGVTRVGSEPMLAELVTRSYFWRRAYLFEDHERARLSPGPSDERTVSLRLRPLGGNELLLVFDRHTSALKSVVSPRFRLEFESPIRYRDLSTRPVAGEIAWTGLPTRRLPDPSVGGWHGTFSQPFAEAKISRADGGITVAARISGVPARLSIDADASGPLRISPEIAKKAGLTSRRDVFGRLLVPGVTLEIGSLTLASLHAEIGATGAPGIDATAGGPLYRETVVEIDPSSEKLRLHDPANWVAPEGFGRNPLDDDGDVPVAILFRSGARVRLRAGTPSASALRLPTPPSGQDEATLADPTFSGLVWGTVRLPPLPVRWETARFDPDWGDHGAIGYPLLLRFHVFFDMPHRWAYVRPL